MKKYIKILIKLQWFSLIFIHTQLEENEQNSCDSVKLNVNNPNNTFEEIIDDIVTYTLIFNGLTSQTIVDYDNVMMSIIPSQNYHPFKIFKYICSEGLNFPTRF